MDITEVKIRKILHEGRVKAIVSIVLDNMFAIHDMKIIERNDDHSLFLAMPYRKTSAGKQLDIAHPLNAQVRSYLEDTVLKAYYAELEQQTE